MTNSTPNEDDVLFIEITVKVRAEDSTTGAFEQARQRAGVPPAAKLKVLENYSMNLVGMGQVVFVDAPRPVFLEFTWTEEV